jgi:hypothetical protein
MNYSLITNPWAHVIVDNFYDAQLYSQAIKEILTYLKVNNLTSRQILIKTSDVNFSTIFPATIAYINSNHIDENTLKLFSKHREYSSISSYSEINICLGDFSYPIHDEASNKLLSAVTYLFPAKNKGTIIYDQNKNLVSEIEWKPNRTLIFAPLDGITWHSYESIGVPLRITVNTFLTR